MTARNSRIPKHANILDGDVEGAHACDGPTVMLGTLKKNARLEVHGGALHIEGDVESGAEIRQYFTRNPPGMEARIGVVVKGKVHDGVTIDADGGIALRNVGDINMLRTRGDFRADDMGLSNEIEAAGNASIQRLDSFSRLKSGGDAFLSHGVEMVTVEAEWNIKLGDAPSASNLHARRGSIDARQVQGHACLKAGGNIYAEHVSVNAHASAAGRIITERDKHGKNFSEWIR